jgi:TorA maturation chaperone TorD
MKIDDDNQTRRWLEAAAVWRFLSLLFQLPTSESCTELRRLVEELPPDQRQRAHGLATIPLEMWETEFHRVLGPAGIPACESSYDENALAGRGPLIADIAGFYEAFAYHPGPAPAEVPDHISVELGFLSYLAVKIAFALYEDQTDEALVAREAYERFLKDHVGYWAGPFRRTVERAASSLYSTGAHWLCALVIT